MESVIRMRKKPLSTHTYTSLTSFPLPHPSFLLLIPTTHPAIYQYIHPSLYLSIYQYIHPSMYLSIYQFIQPSAPQYGVSILSNIRTLRNILHIMCASATVQKQFICLRPTVGDHDCTPLVSMISVKLSLEPRVSCQVYLGYSV